MFRKVLILMAIVLVVSASEVEAVVIDSNWVGGEIGCWCDPCNWEPPIVPDNNDPNTFVVTIDSNYAGVDRVEVSLQQSRTINRLYTYGDVQLYVPDWEDAPSCSTIMFTVLESSNGLTNYGMFEVDQQKHREIEINGDVTNTAEAEIWLSETDINGNVYNESNGVMDIEYECSIRNNVENAGTMNIWGPVVELWVDNTLHNDGLINLFSADLGSNVIINDSNGVIQGFGNFGVEDENNLLQNKGAIYASGGSLFISTEDSHFLNTGVLVQKPSSSLHIKPAVDVNNQGTIQAHSGGGVAFDCNLVNDTNGIIELLGGTLAAKSITQSADANFAGFGGISVTDEILIKSGAKIELTGPTNIVGDVNIPASATLEISDGITLVTGHTTNNGTIHMKGGRLIPQGGITNNGNIIWEPGLYNNVADFNLDGKVNFKDFGDFANTWLWQATWY